MFQPHEDLREELKQRTMLNGVPIADVRWDPLFGALAVYEMDRQGTWSVRRPLLDEQQRPRQIRREDIDEVAWAFYGRNRDVDRWYQRLNEYEAQARAKADQELRERIRDAFKAEVRYKQGHSTIPDSFAMCQHHQVKSACEACNYEKQPQAYYMSAPSGSASNGKFLVTDKRRVS